MRKALAAALLALVSCLSFAQGFPERPVKLIVPLPPGGSPDTIARTLAQGVQGVWKEPVVVDNRPGGSQNIASDLVAKSPADGYTWLLAPDNVFVTNPYLASGPFDPQKDLAPVTLLARIQFLLVVHPSVPAQSVPELVAYAKARPGELNFGSSGTGSPQHLGGLLLPHIRAGKLRALATAASQRFVSLPDTPTVAEAGVPGYSLYPWLGLFVPAKTPSEVVATINHEARRILALEETKGRLVPLGMDLATGSPEELAQLIRDEYGYWGKVIREAGLKGD